MTDTEKGKILTVSRFQRGGEGNETLKAWAVMFALLILAVLILNSSLFSLKSYEIEGNSRVTDEMILRDLELSEGTNLFRYAITHINSNPKVDSRLSTVDVYFKWPNKVRIVVEESTTIGYVYFQGTYLCIDRRGQVANTTYETDEDLPIILGLTVKSFSIGECLNTEDAERYEAVVSVCTALKKYGMETVVNTVNVRVLDDIVLRTDTMEIRVGSVADIERKVAVTAGVLREDIPEGTLHIESMNNQIYIEPNQVVTEDSFNDTIQVDDPEAWENSKAQEKESEEDE